MTKCKVVFRADGDAKMGLGHVVRSLALAEMLNNDFECQFIIRNPLPTLKNQITQVCEKIVELEELEDNESEAENITTTHLSGSEIVVLDGYHFRTEYQNIIKKIGCKLVCIDDIHAYHFVADYIINHAGGLGCHKYSREPYTKLYLGPKYALLRSPFRKVARLRNYENREPGSILICMGGADPKNMTLSILNKCESVPFIKKAYVITGAANPHKETLYNYRDKSSLNVEILSNVSADEMVGIMNKCSVAITSPSTISYEYLSVGGILFLKIIADNQKQIYKYLVNNKLAFDFDKDFTQDHFTERSKSVTYEFDGLQKERFIRLFRFLSLDYRKAQLKDCKLYFEWANEPLSLQQSYNSNPINYADHQKWFKNKILNSNSYLYVFTLADIPIGQIRFDLINDEAMISYSIDKKFRGNGYGSIVLEKGIHAFKNESIEKTKIVGYVKTKNIASVKTFRNLGFAEEMAQAFENSFKFSLE